MQAHQHEHHRGTHHQANRLCFTVFHHTPLPFFQKLRFSEPARPVSGKTSPWEDLVPRAACQVTVRRLLGNASAILRLLLPYCHFLLQVMDQKQQEREKGWPQNQDNPLPAKFTILTFFSAHFVVPPSRNSGFPK
jgi:hypothetical protein